jgi:type 1 glutamine amidotransferase
LLDALYEAGDIRTDVASTYDDAAAIEAGDLLVSYTSQVPAGDEQCQALRRFVERGGRWFAIHASNSVRDNPHLPGILGSRFIAHPPYMRYTVSVTAPGDGLLEGIAPFEVDDELYVIEYSDDIDVLLHAHWGGEARRQQFPAAIRPLMYRRRLGEGGVLYLALGHCNRPFDKPRPDAPDSPDRRGPWALPVYQTLVRRGIEWAAHRRPL